MSGVLSAGAARFLKAHAGTPAELDVLLTLMADADRWWSAADLAAAVHIFSERVVGILDAMAIANLLDVKVGSDVLYRFAPLEDVGAEVEEIDTLRRTDRRAVDRVLEDEL